MRSPIKFAAPDDKGNAALGVNHGASVAEPRRRDAHQACNIAEFGYYPKRGICR